MHDKKEINDVPRHSGTSQGINRVANMKDFLCSWDDPSHPKNAVSVPLYCTSHGNINTTGVVGNYRAHVFSRRQQQFRESLEAGIKDLVLLLVDNFNWITYTSCEGHHYGYSSIEPVIRKVGIVPRSPEEAQTIRSILKDAANKVNPVFGSTVIQVAITSNVVETESKPFPVINLQFRKLNSAPWQSYFGQLVPLYNALVAALREQYSSIQDTLKPGNRPQQGQ